MNKTAVPPSLLPPIKEGILPVDKPKGKSSFSLVMALRRITGIEKIGHAGTLDPIATGVMIMLIGKAFTKLSVDLINHDKEYRATLRLGQTTDTFDEEGQILSSSDHIPTLLDIEQTLKQFQGKITQIPPMFSAKKINGKKLYELARQGKTIERQPIQVELTTKLLSYDYPHLQLHIACSKGTYVRTLADDLGRQLGCGAYLQELTRLRCGPYHLEQCINGSLLYDR
jgi:tRNA pseudouridine55 synthase